MTRQEWDEVRRRARAWVDAPMPEYNDPDESWGAIMHAEGIIRDLLAMLDTAGPCDACADDPGPALAFVEQSERDREAAWDAMCTKSVAVERERDAALASADAMRAVVEAAKGLGALGCPAHDPHCDGEDCARCHAIDDFDAALAAYEARKAKEGSR